MWICLEMLQLQELIKISNLETIRSIRFWLRHIPKGEKTLYNIWGYETRDTKNRKIVYETKILNKVDPPDDVITEDPTKPTSYHKVTQSAHTGYTAELYKIVYENGVEVSRTLVNRSKYAPAPRYVINAKVVEEKRANGWN